MLEALNGQSIGVPDEGGERYHPYSVEPVDNPSRLAAALEEPAGLTIAKGELPNPGGRNLVDFFKDGTVVRAFDLIGVIFHNSNRIELTDSPLDSVVDGHRIAGVGGITIASPSDFTLSAIVTGISWRADMLASEGATVTRREDGLYIARIPPAHFEITDKSKDSVVGERLQPSW